MIPGSAILFSLLLALCCHSALSAPPLLQRVDGNHKSKSVTWQVDDDVIDLLPPGIEEFMIVFRQFWRQGRVDEFGRVEDPIIVPTCPICIFAVNAIKSLLSTGMSEEKFANTIIGMCKTFKIEPDEVCDGIIDVYAPEFYYIGHHVNMSSLSVCAVVIQSINCTTDDPTMQWTVTVDVGPKPPHKDPVLPPDGSPRMKILHITDLHYDNSYVENSSIVCPEPLCCRSNKSMAKTSDLAAGHWGSYGPCDIPRITLINTLENIKKEHGDDLDFVIMTGDLPAHNVWSTSREANLAQLRDVNDLLYKYFPNIPVYGSLGNHEPHPVDSYPYQEVPDERFNPSWLYNATADAWSRWLPEDALKTVRYAGFYSVQAKPGLRIISLNTNFCYTLNWWVLYNSHDPENHLAWLANELLEAEKKGDKVHIIGHIAPGDTTCWQIWSREFSKLLFRFEDTVAAHFYAHTHWEEVRLSYDPENYTRPTTVMYVAGSVTTFDSLNPGYRIYEIDGSRPDSTWMVLDFSTYTFNMTQANLEGEPQWYRLFSAKEDFGLKNLLPEEWNRLIYQMATDPPTFDLFYKLYTKGSDFFAAQGCDLTCRQAVLCQLVTVDNSNMTRCEEIEAQTVTQKSLSESHIHAPHEYL